MLEFQTFFCYQTLYYKAPLSLKEIKRKKEKKLCMQKFVCNGKQFLLSYKMFNNKTVGKWRDDE